MRLVPAYTLPILILMVSLLGYKLYGFNRDFSIKSRSVSEEIANLKTNIKRIDEQNSVLHESINPRDTRWAKIKLVRKIIQDDMKDNGLKYDLTIKDLTEMSAAIVDNTNEFDMKMSLILAVIRVESAYNKKAISRAGAQGLMQLMPETAKECADDLNMKYYNVFKIKDNIRLGTWYKWKVLNMFQNDIELGIRAYNAGPTMVKKVLAGEILEFPSETREYLKKVLEWKAHYEDLGIDL